MAFITQFLDYNVCLEFVWSHQRRFTKTAFPWKITILILPIKAFCQRKEKKIMWDLFMWVHYFLQEYSRIGKLP